MTNVELTEFDRDAARAIAAGCPAEARSVAQALGRTSWSNAHYSLARLEAHGVIRMEHGKRSTGHLAPDIVVIAGDVCRMIPVGEL